MRDKMKQAGRIAALLLTALLILSTSACMFLDPVRVEPDVSEPPTAEPEVTDEIDVEPTETAAAEETEIQPTEPEPEESAQAKIPPEKIQEETLITDDSCGSYVHLTAYDGSGEIMWEYVSPVCIATELECVQYLGIFGELVYINEQNIDEQKEGVPGGHLRALDVYTGEVVWDNTDFRGASASWDYDERSGILYVAGYYGPDCCAIDKDGKTLWIAKALNPDWYWPYNVTVSEDRIDIAFSSGDGYEAALDLNGNLIEP